MQTDREGHARTADHDCRLLLVQPIPGDEQDRLSLRLAERRKRCRHKLAPRQYVGVIARPRSNRRCRDVLDQRGATTLGPTLTRQHATSDAQ